MAILIGLDGGRSGNLKGRSSSDKVKVNHQPENYISEGITLTEHIAGIDDAFGGIKNHKGYFTSDVELKKAYPTPEVGWYAYVGSTGTIWIVEDDIWLDSENPIPVEDITELATKDEVDAKQDKLPIDAEEGDIAKLLNEKGAFSNISHSQLQEIDTDEDFQHVALSEKKKLEDIKVNSESGSEAKYISEKGTAKKLPEIPTKVSDLENDKGYAEIEDIDAQREELFRVVNISISGMITLKPTTRNFTYKLTVLQNVLINIDLSKMIDQIGSARCRLIVDIPIARTITWVKPLLWSGDIPVLTAGQYIFEIINIGNIPLIWLVASTQKKAYSGVTLFVDGEGANYTEAEINGEVATREENSWANPFRYLQNAINAAQAGDVIFVKEGTYYPTHKRKTAIYQDGDHADRGATFTIKREVDIYGGFVGTEIKLWQRELDEKGFQANETILNGDIKRNADKDDFANNVVYDETQAYTYINGFSITNGNANIEGVNDGGGINSISYSLVKVLCKVSKCESSGYGGGWRRGVAFNCIAVDCNTTNGTTFGGGWSQGANYSCEVYNSSSTNGGGWYGGNNYNCVAYNTVGYSGGAFYGGLNYNCIAIACEGYNGGAFYSGLNYNCIAIACEGYNGAGLLSATCTNINCLLLGNTNSSGTIIGFSDSAGSGVQIFRNNAYDTTHPSITGGEGSDIDTSTCIQNLTKEQAQITLPSFAGVPTTQAQKQELKEYVKNIREHLKPLKTSILRGAGINNATYPNTTDFEGVERPEDCTIGAFEAEE